MLPSGAQPMQSGDTVNPVFPSLRRETGMLCVIATSLYLLLTSTPKMGVQGRSPLPEREVSSHVSLPHGGPQARQKKYEWISVFSS